MKRHAGKKVVNTEWQPVEFLCPDLWHRAPIRCSSRYRLKERPSVGSERGCPILPRFVRKGGIVLSALTAVGLLAQDGSQELLCIGSADHANHQGSPIGESSHLKRQKGAAFALRNQQFR